jgi:hypothetical protein
MHSSSYRIGAWGQSIRKRPTSLSITHNFCADGGAQFDISHARQPSPHDHIARREGRCFTSGGGTGTP